MFKKKLIGITLISLILCQNILGTLNVSAVTEPFEVVKPNSFGGNYLDYFDSIINTSDNGIIAVGSSYSNNIEGISNKGGRDCIIVKYDSNGNKQWINSFGGNEDDYLYSAISTSDGGIVAVGYSISVDIEGVTNKGGFDGIIVKYDSNGNQEWINSFGGNGGDCFTSVTNTSDGGFIAVGYSSSYSITNKSNEDCIIVKYDSSGNQQWIKSFGGSSYDYFKSVTSTSDNGFIAVGHSLSTNIEGITNKGRSDAIIVKYDNNGNQVWIKNFGGNGYDYLNSVTSTSDGGFITVGNTNSDNIGSITTYNSEDALIVKYDSNGNQEWINSLGGSGEDFFTSVINTSDEGIIAVGYSNSTDIIGITNNGLDDGIIVKYDSSGNQEWVKSLGGSSYDYFNSVTSTSDGKIVAVGNTESTNIEGIDNKGQIDAIIVSYSDTAVAPVERLNAIDTLDLQIVADNSLEMALSTNQISFTGYNGVADLTNNDLNITVTSGLYYDLYAILNDDLRGSNDTNAIINKNNLGIKTLEDINYKNFINIGEPLKIVENHVNGRNINHNINLKLKGDSSVKADTYSTTITFETIQK